MIRFSVWFISAYLIGSVSFSIVLFRILGKNDPRKAFSGNAGTTNVYRQAGFLSAALVLGCDMGRAMIVAYLSALHLSPDFVPWICLGLILGNRFPCFHRFSGGKGVANYLGFTLVVAPVAALLSMLAWVVVHRLARYPFIGSLVMVMILAIGTLTHVDLRLLGIFGVLLTMGFVLFNHRRNVREWMHKGGQSGIA